MGGKGTPRAAPPKGVPKRVRRGRSGAGPISPGPGPDMGTIVSDRNMRPLQRLPDHILPGVEITIVGWMNHRRVNHNDTNSICLCQTPQTGQRPSRADTALARPCLRHLAAVWRWQATSPSVPLYPHVYSGANNIGSARGLREPTWRSTETHTRGCHACVPQLNML